MDPIINIATTHAGHYFSFFYFLAYLVCFLLLLYMGYRRRYPLKEWSLLVTCGMILFIIGTKLFAYDREQWLILLNEFRFSPTDKKTVLGGLLLLVPGFVLLKKVLGFRFPVFDLLAIVLPVVMAIQRMGCLVAGCCFGKPTTLPWGITYGKFHLPYQVHLHQGLIDPGDPASLMIHPNQLYHILFCFAIAFFVWMTRKKWKAGFSQFLFSILLYGVFRFFMEFLRDPAANFIAHEVVWGLAKVQWLILLFNLVILMVIIGCEKYSSHTRKGLPKSRSGVQVLFLLIVLLVCWAGKNWFTPVENLVIVIATATVFGVYILNFYKRITVERLRWALPVIFILGLVSMGQQIYLPTDKSTKTVYNEYGLGFMASEYYADVRQYLGTYEGCMGTSYNFSDPDTRRYRNYLGGFQWSYTELYQQDRRFNFQLNFFVASDHIESQESNYEAYETTFGINPYMQYDGGWVGFGGGFHLGSLRYEAINMSANKLDLNEWENSKSEFIIQPQLHLRIGPRDYLYLEGNLANHFPSSSPMPYQQAGFGSGLGSLDGRMIGVGISEAGPYIKSTWPISNKFYLGAYYAGNFNEGTARKQVFSLSIKYRPRYDVVPRPPRKPKDSNDNL